MPQHDPAIPAGLDTIEAVRGPIRRLADRFADKHPADIATGALFAAHDLAMRCGLDPAAAVEWIRTSADEMERMLIAQGSQA